MPSGSHRSRGGSHFSGGGSRRSIGNSGSRGSSLSSRGGSHFHRSTFGHGGVHHRTHVHIGPRRIYLGRHRYYYGGSSSLWPIAFVFILFALFFAFFNGASLSSNKDAIAMIESDYYYYQDMIDNAISDTRYQVDATVTGKYYNDYAGKYYITYKIEEANLEGETYSTYTLTETGQYRIGTTIKVAVDSIPVNMNTDSIPMHYKGMSIEADGEYSAIKKDISNNIIGLSISIGVIVLVIFISITYMYKNSKVEDNKTKNESEKTITNDEVSKCNYCGSIVDKKARKCPGCGAGLKR